MVAARNSSYPVESARLLVRSLATSAVEDPWHLGGFIVLLLFGGTVVLIVLLTLCCDWLHCLDTPAMSHIPVPESETQIDPDKLEMKERAGPANSTTAD